MPRGKIEGEKQEEEEEEDDDDENNITPENDGDKTTTKQNKKAHFFLFLFQTSFSPPLELRRLVPLKESGEVNHSTNKKQIKATV